MRVGDTAFACRFKGELPKPKNWLGRSLAEKTQEQPLLAGTVAVIEVLVVVPDGFAGIEVGRPVAGAADVLDGVRAVTDANAVVLLGPRIVARRQAIELCRAKEGDPVILASHSAGV